MNISKAELEIMKVLWRKNGLGASEVYDALEADHDWNIRTVKTMLSRLVDKGALETSPDKRRFRYHTLINETDFKQAETRKFVDRVFAGRAAPLVAHLADARGLSDQDIKDLEALLGKLKS